MLRQPCGLRGGVPGGVDGGGRDPPLLDDEDGGDEGGACRDGRGLQIQGMTQVYPGHDVCALPGPSDRRGLHGDPWDPLEIYMSTDSG